MTDEERREAYHRGYQQGRFDEYVESWAKLWISAETPPQENGDYLVYDAEDGIYVDSYYLEDGTEEYGFQTYAGWQSCYRVLAWMPLPPPYRPIETGLEQLRASLEETQ